MPNAISRNELLTLPACSSGSMDARKGVRDNFRKVLRTDRFRSWVEAGAGCFGVV
jgi:hypothetical protein